MDWNELLNSRPAWLVALAVTLYLLPKILQQFAPFVPGLSRLMTANAEREDAMLHHKLDSDSVSQAQTIKFQERMLGILEASLDKMWQDRAETLKRLEEIDAELTEMRLGVIRNNDLLTAHSINISKLADEQEDFKVIGERIGS